MKIMDALRSTMVVLSGAVMVTSVSFIPNLPHAEFAPIITRSPGTEFCY